MSEYKSDLLADLEDPAYLAEYLSAAYADSTEAFLVALRDVVEVQKGSTKFAVDAGNQEDLYRMLSEGDNPRSDTLLALLRALPIRVIFEPVQGKDTH